MKKRVFAIGFKNWIELRSSVRPPIEEVTTCLIPPRNRLYKNRFKIKVVHHKGGRVLKCLKGNGIYGGPNGYIIVPDGQMVELPSDVAAQFLKEAESA